MLIKDTKESISRMCLWGKRTPATSEEQRQQVASARKTRREPVVVRESSVSTTDVSGVTTFTASRENISSKESQTSGISSSSSNTTTSSLAGIRELLQDGAVIYRYKELAGATDNFSESKKLGGSVYRATVRGSEVAVVRKRGSFVPNHVELIKVLASVHHLSLVKFLGACFRESEFVHLCYEYVPGVNLRDALHGSRVDGFTVLSKWTSRLQVAADLALGLEYLHDHTMPTFVHKHVKSTNIIVTNDLRAKLVKFGVPQLLGEVPSSVPDEKMKEITEEGDEEPGRKLTRSNSVRITGTPGYMSPEYMTTGTVTSKMDVYAFGVVLLELLTGQQQGVQVDPVSKRMKVISLPDNVKEVMNSSEPRKKLRLWVDPRLKDSYPIDTALRIASLAKQCVESDPALRPPMENVAARLSSYLCSSLEWERSFLAFRELQSQTMEGR